MSAADIVAALVGRWHGNYGMARCPAHNDGKEPALKVSDDPRKNDDIDVHCFAGCDWQDVKAALRRRGLLVDHGDGQNRNLARGCHRDDGRQHDQHVEHVRQRRQAALDIWRASRSASETAVENYLASRGIVGPPPASLRYHPHLRHSPTALFFEAMVAGIQQVDGQVVAIHRTFLLPGGQGKAGISTPKMALGSYAGGAVRFAAPAPELILGEGIETTLSVMQATGKPAWACLGTSGLKSVILPPEVKTVIIAADGDEKGEEAAQAAAQRFATEGRAVSIARPPDGRGDFNDALMGAVA